MESGGTVLPSYENTESAPDQLPSFEETEHPDNQPLPSYDSTMDLSQQGSRDIVGGLKAGVQGLASGFIPGAEPIEAAIGLRTKEDINEEQQKYPLQYGSGKVAGTIASMETPLGPLNMLGKAAAGAVGAEVLGAVGAKIASNIAQVAGQSAIDETSKYLLGQYPQGAQDAVAHFFVNAGIGSALSAAAGVLGPPVSKLAGNTAQKGWESMVNNGQKTLEELATNPGLEKKVTALGGLAAGYLTVKHGDNPIYTYGAGYLAKKVLGKPLSIANEHIGNAITWALAKASPKAIPAAYNFGSEISKGVNALEPLIENAFRAGITQIIPAMTESKKDKIKEDVEQGGVNQQILNQMNYENTVPQFASGGEVPVAGAPNHFAKVFPEANVLINTAKGRVYNYLNSIRPLENTPKFPFDSATPQKSQKRSYNKALELAGNPLSIMNGINNGSLTHEDMAHFTNLWPEVHDLISKKLQERIVKAQLKKEKPDYKKRQAMSLFIGAPLDSTLTPQSIAAVQGLYAMKQVPQQAPPTKGKKGTAPLSKAPNSYLTDSQSREQRQQNSKA